jgi:ATP phosphoribosyltransferase
MLNLVIPKGSLEEKTLELFERADLSIWRKGERSYNGEISDPRIKKVKILRPQEIPRYVEEGYFDLGITGLDWVKESRAKVKIVSSLSYSKKAFGNKVKIVLCVSQDSEIKNPKQIKSGSKISTEYPNLTKKYFQKSKIPVRIYLSYGATEAKIPEIVDAIVEITDTGSTLKEQGLKIIDTILESQTVLIANRKSYQDKIKKKEIEEIQILLEGALIGLEKVLIKFNVSEKRLKNIIKILPAMKAPTITKLSKENYFAVETVCPKSEINLLIPRLKNNGADDIIEIPISKIVF